MLKLLLESKRVPCGSPRAWRLHWWASLLAFEQPKHRSWPKLPPGTTLWCSKGSLSLVGGLLRFSPEVQPQLGGVK